ncbi:MAG TPA: ABC transporter ATP-binding protein [Bacillota bacterium]|nr:ABC transporter ATP-binding protein [Bacillota bacterium]
MVVTENLTKVFGSMTAVDRVGLRVERGDIFGLVGPDGAGKTTLLRMICGLIAPTSGHVRLFGEGGGKSERGVFGYMPQRFSLYGDLTVMENIRFIASLYKIDRKTVDRRAGEILEMTGLNRFKSRFADDLSGGMKQKLSLTCALVTRPSLLVLDEPTYGVDPESRKEFWKILYQLNKEGVTVLVSTSYMDEAEYCKRVAFMDGGKIMSTDTPGRLKENFAYSIVELKTDVKDLDFLNGLPEVADAGFFGDRYHLAVREADRSVPAIAKALADKGIEIYHLEIIPPSMEDVFVFLAEREAV